MSIKLLTNIIGFGVLLLSVILIKSSWDLMILDSDSEISAGYYPLLLSILLGVFVLLDMLKATLKKEASLITFPNLKVVLVTIVLTVLFILVWISIGYFYISLTIYSFLLFTIYRIEVKSNSKHIVNVLFSVGTSFIIYLLIDVLMKVKF